MRLRRKRPIEGHTITVRLGFTNGLYDLWHTPHPTPTRNYVARVFLRVPLRLQHRGSARSSRDSSGRGVARCAHCSGHLHTRAPQRWADFYCSYC